MTDENIVVVDNLTKKFGDFTAVNQISFNIPQGEIFGLLGPNGAGKTTTIRMLCGIIRPTSGTAHINGYDIIEDPESVKKNIGYMSQQFSLYNDLTVYENLDFYARIYDVPDKQRNDRVRELIEMAGLVGYEKVKTSNLSGAWRQRLALGCSIVHRPRMLFLDEPTAGVDPISRKEFWDLIYEMAGQGVSVLATTHYMDEAEYCNMIGLIHQARLIALDDPDTLKEEMPGVLFEIDCSAPGRALGILKMLEGVIDVARHGTLLHVTVEAEKHEKKIRQTLDGANIDIYQIEKVLPSLEDVFVSLVEEKYRIEVKEGIE